MSTRREIHRLTFFRLLIDRDLPMPDYIRDSLPQIRQADTRRTLRKSTAMTLPNNRTMRFQKSFIPDTTRKWNKLPKSTRTYPSHKQIKSQITNFIGIEHPPKYFTFGAKLGNTLHTQLRVGMSKLNSHLFKVQNTILHPHAHADTGQKVHSTLHCTVHYTQNTGKCSCKTYQTNSEKISLTSHIQDSSKRYCMGYISVLPAARGWPVCFKTS